MNALVHAHGLTKNFPAPRSLRDLVSGRRGLFATSLVSAVAAVSGWFLAVRVFGVSTMNEWTWVLWSLAAATLALGAFFLFRSKR